MKLKGYGLQAAMKKKQDQLHQELADRNQLPKKASEWEKKLIESETLIRNLSENERKIVLQIVRTLKVTTLSSRSICLVAEVIALFKKFQSQRADEKSKIKEEDLLDDEKRNAWKEKFIEKNWIPAIQTIFGYSIQRQKALGLTPPEREEYADKLFRSFFDTESITDLLNFFENLIKSIISTRVEITKKNLDEIASYLGLPLNTVATALNTFLKPKKEDLEEIRKDVGPSIKITIEKLAILILENRIEYRSALEEISKLDYKSPKDDIIQKFNVARLPKNNPLIFYSGLNALIGHSPFYKERSQYVEKLYTLFSSLERLDHQEIQIEMLELLTRIPMKNRKFFYDLFKKIQFILISLDESDQHFITNYYSKIAVLQASLTTIISRSVIIDEEDKIYLAKISEQINMILNLKTYKRIDGESQEEENRKKLEHLVAFLEHSVKDVLQTYSIQNAKEMLQLLKKFIQFHNPEPFKYVLFLLEDRQKELIQKKVESAQGSSAIEYYNTIDSMHILVEVCHFFQDGLFGREGSDYEFLIKKLNSIKKNTLEAITKDQ